MSRKKRCIVHIGMPKTGTSALQEVLHSSIDDSSGSISYMKLNSPNHGGVIYSLFAENPLIHNIHRLNKHTKDEIDEFNSKNRKLIENDFIKYDTDNKIISGEDIFHMNENELNLFKNFLNRFFEQITIIGYVRPISSFMNSSFQQLVKFHSLNSFEIKKIYPHYRKKLEKFDHVFGRENVKLYLYDPNEFPDRDIVKHFSKLFDIRIKDTNIQKFNESISLELMSILFSYNLYRDRKDFGKKNTIVHRRMINQLSAFGRNKFSFSDAFIESIIENNLSDIHWIEKRIGKKFPKEEIQNNYVINTEEDLKEYSLDIYFEFNEYLKGKYGKKIFNDLDHATYDNIFRSIESVKENIYHKL